MSQHGRNKPAVVFIHGFGSSAECWGRLLELLRADPQIAERFDLRTFAYPTSILNVRFLRRIPRLEEVANSLAAYLDSPDFGDRDVHLVGHSQGGLVIQRYLADMLQRGLGRRLAAIRQVITFATPTRGTEIASLPRKVVFALFANPQERSFRVLNPQIADLERAIRERVVGARTFGDMEWPISFLSFWGQQDRVVREASARAAFDNTMALQGDHFTILRPDSPADPRYAELREALLEPVGHAHIYEVERFELTATLEPTDGDKRFRFRHGDRTLTVKCESVGHVLQRVTFSRRNRNAAPFMLRYGLEEGGYVKPTVSHTNEASSADLAAYREYGLQYVFRFTPRPGETFALNLDVYKGFERGNRDIHMHLQKDGQLSRFRLVTFRLDLSAYQTAGMAVGDPPRLFVHPYDPQGHDICDQRVLDTPLPPTEQEAAAVWRWDLHDVREGVVDLEWEAALPEPPRRRRRRPAAVPSSAE